MRPGKIISAGSSEGARSWSPPSMGGAPNTNISLTTAKQVDDIHRQAREEGLRQGRDEAFQAARPRLEDLLSGLSRPLNELDEACLQELAMLVKSVARQLVRRELRSDPGEIVAVVREAMTALPSATRQTRIHLHPEDAQLVRDALSVSDGERLWTLIEDPAQERGGCRVMTDISSIDASLETRLNAVTARLLGGHRDDDAER
jgi:flagellar assembly protein FliH